MENLLKKDIVGSIGLQKYLCTITWDKGTIIMDEPKELEGGDLGPDPYSLLLASLAGCTLSTLRMYIDRKGWDVPVITVTLNMYQEKIPVLTTIIKRDISFTSVVPEEQKIKLLTIATKCPVSRILENRIEIENSI